MGVSELSAYYEPRCGPRCKYGNFDECQRRNRMSGVYRHFLRLPCLDVVATRPPKQQREKSPVRPGTAQDIVLQYLRERPGQWVPGRVLERETGLRYATRVQAGSELRIRGLVETNNPKGYRALPVPADN